MSTSKGRMDLSSRRMTSLSHRSAASYRRILARYDLASAKAIDIPESDFLSEMRRHKMKRALAAHLESHPSASLFLTGMRFWIRDNFSKPQNDDLENGT